MRAAIAAAFAVGAMAVPYVKPRQEIDWVTDIEIEYATVIVTVTEGADAAAATTTTTRKHYGHHNWHPWSSRSSSSSAAAPTTEAPAPTTTTEAPAPTTTTEAPAPTTTTEAPAPTTESTTAQAAPTTSASSSPAAAPSSSYSAPAPSGYSGTVVWHHNVHRSNHSAPDIQWSDALAATAQKIGESCVYAHDTATDKDTIGGYGQNIAAGVAASDIGVIISDLFYNGEVGWFRNLYEQAQPSMTDFEHWGHFSQVVWKDTTHVGCATVDCSAQGLANVGSGVSPVFTVCNYQNPGNYQNEYGDNVGKGLGRPTVMGDATM